nr:translesion error-prone DNA polymerase V autoproteolytic subunit [Dongshaea marina]
MLSAFPVPFESRVRLCCPLFRDPVVAGFPSPASDFAEKSLDLNELCIQHPAATYFLRVQGDSMTEAGIFDGDIVVVDRALIPQHGDIVIAALNGEFTIKRLHKKTSLKLLACNPAYSDIEVGADDQFELFGVVSSAVRCLR